MNNNKTYYTAADYSRYHRGEMSAAEMNKMEKAALQDSFIQDALDGYVHTKTGEQDIELLRKRLEAFEKKDEVAVAGGFKNWWKIAAVFLIAATVSFLIYNASNNEVVPKLADAKTEEVKTQDTSISNDIAQANPNMKDNNEVKITDGVGEKGEEIVVVASPKSTAIARNIGKNIVEIKAVEKIGKNFKVDGTIVTDEGLPITNATIIATNKEILATTDDKGKFEFESKKAELDATIINEGYQQRKQTLVANQSTTVVMKDQIQAANTPNNAAKQKAMAQAPMIASNVAQPSNGWEDYNSYLKQNTAVVYNEAGIKQSGTVILNFEIDKKGSPEKITLKKSNCEGCNLAAIQVLKDGPKWIGKSGVQNEIAIIF